MSPLLCLACLSKRLPSGLYPIFIKISYQMWAILIHNSNFFIIINIPANKQDTFDILLHIAGIPKQKNPLSRAAKTMQKRKR
jgi:hypothetical protein